MTLFPSALLPSVRYVTTWFNAENPVVYAGEKYQKQTCRNRMTILSSQGKIPLIIPVKNGSSSKLFMKDAEIDYTDRWQKRYWHSLISAYQNAPYFEHYTKELEVIWFQQVPLLHEFNQMLMAWLFRMLKVKHPEPQFCKPTRSYNNLMEDNFMIPAGNELVYKQVFSYKLPFTPNLSTLDLLMNKGPEAVYWLCCEKKMKFIASF